MASVKNILDYYEQMYEKYPTVRKLDIKRILQYGWKSLYLHNNYGADTIILRKGFWFYCGKLMKDSLKYFNYYAMKMGVKLRITYHRKKITWDGYYYFGLTQYLYEQYLQLINKKGRPKKWYIFNKVMAYKIYDECCVRESNKVAIFRMLPTLEGGFTLYYDKLRTDTAELLFVREPLKFKDILVTNYNYLLLNDTNS